MRQLLRQVCSGLRFRLAMVVALACLPLVVLMLHSAGEDRRRQRVSWQQRAQRMTELAAREERKLVGQTRQLLVAMAESSVVRSANRRGCKKLVDELFTSYPRYANLAVIRTNEEVLASAVPLVGPLDPANQSLILRTLETGEFAVGHSAFARPAAPPAVYFGYPVLDRTGQKQGIVFAALDLDWSTRLGPELPRQLPEGATWTETDREGTVLVRYPDQPEWVGQKLPEKGLLHSVFSAANGMVEAPDPKGVPGLYAFATARSQLGFGHSVAILGISKSVLFAEADRTLMRNLSWLAIAAGLALVLGWCASNVLVLRPVKALVKSSALLAAGDLTARTGVSHGTDELGELTASFDRMARVLEQRELDREGAARKLHMLSQRLVDAQETERRHIALELHDGICQALTVAEMNLQTILQSPGAELMSPRLAESLEVIQQVLEQVHDLALNLRPSMLDDLGLEPALRWLTQRQAELAGIQAEFRQEPLSHRLDPEVETECFRVAQEALTNVVRHAHARHVAVRLREENGHLHLSVHDDGVGFEVAAVRNRAMHGTSLGLLSMEERATLVGGGLKFISAPGQGTEVRAWFPLRWQNPPT